MPDDLKTEIDQIVTRAVERGVERALVALSLGASPQPQPQSEWVDGVEGGKLLGGYEQRWLVRNGAPAYRIGRSLRYKRDELIAWFNSRATAATPAAKP